MSDHQTNLLDAVIQSLRNEVITPLPLAEVKRRLRANRPITAEEMWPIVRHGCRRRVQRILRLMADAGRRATRWENRT